MNTEIMIEMMAQVAETRKRMYYLSYALRCDLSTNARRGAEAQMEIFKDEIAEINDMLDSELEIIDIGDLLQGIQ